MSDMKRLYINITAACVLTFFLVSCFYDNEEALYPALDTTCDSANVTFNVTVVSVLSNNCYSCHSNQNAAGRGNNIRLQDYADVKSGNVAIAGSIKHTGSYSPMPKNGGTLKTCSINQFDIWVRNGMLNN
jgi:hypothetical protein